MNSQEQLFNQLLRLSDIERYNSVFTRPQYILFESRWTNDVNSTAEYDVVWAESLKPRCIVCDAGSATRIVLSENPRFTWTSYYAEKLLWELVVGDDRVWLDDWLKTLNRTAYAIQPFNKRLVWMTLYHYAEQMASKQQASTV